MQIVIDIPDGLYTQTGKIQNGSMTAGNLLDCIKNGIPLPKGHGRLVDAGELLTITNISEDGNEYSYIPYDEIENASTIIEADKEDKNGN